MEVDTLVAEIIKDGRVVPYDQDRRPWWKSCCRLRRSTSKGVGMVSDSGLITHFDGRRGVGWLEIEVTT